MTESQLRTLEKTIAISGVSKIEETRHAITLAQITSAERNRLYDACDRRIEEITKRHEAMAVHSCGDDV